MRLGVEWVQFDRRGMQLTEKRPRPGPQPLDLTRAFPGPHPAGAPPGTSNSTVLHESPWSRRTGLHRRPAAHESAWGCKDFTARNCLQTECIKMIYPPRSRREEGKRVKGYLLGAVKLHASLGKARGYPVYLGNNLVKVNRLLQNCLVFWNLVLVLESGEVLVETIRRRRARSLEEPVSTKAASSQGRTPSGQDLVRPRFWKNSLRRASSSPGSRKTP